MSLSILDAVLYHGETWELMGRRWGKIEKDFCTKTKRFDISKIPDIYDCIKYDLQHNQHTLQFEQAEELYMYAKYLADIVIPQVRLTYIFSTSYLQSPFLGIRINSPRKANNRTRHLHTSLKENQSRLTAQHRGMRR